MPNFPSISAIPTSNLDAGSDEPRLARADLLQTTQNVNSIRTAFDGKNLAAVGDVNAYSSQQYVSLATLTDAASISWNLNTQQVAQVTLGGNRALAAPTNQQAGATYVLIVRQDGSGSKTLSFDSVYKFPGGTDPVLTTTANAVDLLTFISDGTNMYGAAAKDLK